MTDSTPQSVTLREAADKLNPYPEGSPRNAWRNGFMGHTNFGAKGSDFDRIWKEGKQASAALSHPPAPEQASGEPWIPVSVQMPKSGQIVLALQRWDRSGKLSVIRAAWSAPKTEEASPESDHAEYDEATDTYYDPEGWYEQISHWDDYAAVFVSGAQIVAWMPMPSTNAATPTAEPAGEPDPQLCKFYQVKTYPELVAAQAHHIEKLQAKLPPLRNEQPGKVREG